ncbi:putative bifunctional diguanylate cyclase/phosphodiesterase [Pseudophaeobacter leonis]|uniref:putative bifunctional diguanylate cyclase/phosphodiesterase n=1 Tax=Pseudophaeobacter leonis TaxID=1144477 RepID=UPI00137477E8|nr:EAL domain-containing protein [Pseudophaeobacter leonis]
MPFFEQSRSVRGYTPTLITILAVIGLSYFAVLQRETINAQTERDYVRAKLQTQAAQIEGRLNAIIGAASGLVATLSTEPDMSPQRYGSLARNIVSSSTGIRNIAAARDLVVNLVYPLEGNEFVLGLDYRLNDEQRAAAFRARDTGTFTLAGPVELVQGGEALIGRFPVFSGGSSQRQFWGIISVVVDLTSFYEETGLTELSSDLEIVLLGKDGLRLETNPFFGSAETLKSQPESIKISFLNGSWDMSALPIGGWGSTISDAWIKVSATLITLIISCLTGLANFIALQRSAIIHELQKRELQLEQSHSEIEMHALHDHLTGLPNRRFLERRLNEKTSPPIHGLMILDLDGFKSVNDLFGHKVGDSVLVAVTQRLQRAVGQKGFLARSGGDEFVLLCESDVPDKDNGQNTLVSSSERLQAMAERLLECLQDPIVGNDTPIRMGISIGIRSIESNEEWSASSWLKQADRAMYQSKKEGRDRFTFYDDLEHLPEASKVVRNDLLDAIELGQILPHYQPQFGSDGITLIGVEALARWLHPSEGLKSPNDFLSIAEEIKIDSAIDLCILASSINDIREWDRLQIKVPSVSINLSLRSLNDPRFLENIDALDADPSRTSFELLETIFLDTANHILEENVAGLKRRGFRVEVDDFGTGHSSVTSLLKMKPHGFKIDRSLVQAATNSPENSRLLASIAEVGHALGIEICAEGIEDELQLSNAMSIGCTRFQGYFLGRPMPRAAIIEFLEARECPTQIRKVG